MTFPVNPDDPRIQKLMGELQAWPGPGLSSHKSARQFFHKLAFLADAGLDRRTPGMGAIIEKIIAHRDSRGIPQLPVTISKAHGGSGEELWGWALCDAPTILYALIKMGYRDGKVDEAIGFLAEKRTECGWSCTVSEELGKWRGPGKKTDPCPYAVLLMTKLLLEFNQPEYTEAVARGAEILLDLWENSRTKHPYIFYMGTDFRKLKLPFIWYDILHVCYVLSRVPGIHHDPRFTDMQSVLFSRQKDENGYIPESVYLEWKDWDFGQKKKSSELLTFCIERIRNKP